eukprot:3893180-Rhodomonas_salina.1
MSSEIVSAEAVRPETVSPETEMKEAKPEKAEGRNKEEEERWMRQMKGEGSRAKDEGLRAVSYTHLTLPTICSV